MNYIPFSRLRKEFMIASICKRELEREALGKLPRLAAKGAYLEPGDAGTRAVLNLMSPRNDHSAPVAKWERVIWLTRSIDMAGSSMIRWAAPSFQTVEGRGLPGRGVKRVAAKAAANVSSTATAAGRRRSSGDAGDLAVVVDDAESPLAWLASRKGPDGRPLLSQQMFDAGERLRRDFEAGQMSERVTAQWGASIMPGARGRSGLPGQTLTASERALAARQRVWKALQHAGPGLSSVLLEVCCLSSGLEAAERHLKWPKRSAKLVLLIALERLVQHYGYDGNASVRQSSTASDVGCRRLPSRTARSSSRSIRGNGVLTAQLPLQRPWRHLT
jgi:hypothetical protein